MRETRFYSQKKKRRRNGVLNRPKRVSFDRANARARHHVARTERDVLRVRARAEHSVVCVRTCSAMMPVF
jgi:hypothetical protein